ncbi:hypothetical protein FisN_30Hh084 [Fistulifera solaris]|uniref:GRIP domain-containing protein n=1 Tax=Fistulifera solaris TaxID=1519565 RepID=A0A1Z5K6H1_FISSO|nr:hypothetical protein FisN_30Hh084 [Fistulifera solaris]|eukprot:GAX21883.1 hypothetical protein FisN_30Hh084 [Fistulifera solaris]
MWNLTDLAKRAQELQEQANLAASTFSVTSGFSLNLDAMQQQQHNETTAASPARPVETPPIPPDSPMDGTPPIANGKMPVPPPQKEEIPIPTTDAEENTIYASNTSTAPEPIPTGSSDLPTTSASEITEDSVAVQSEMDTKNQDTEIPITIPNNTDEVGEDVKPIEQHPAEIETTTEKIEADEINESPDETAHETALPTNESSPPVIPERSPQTTVHLPITETKKQSLVLLVSSSNQSFQTAQNATDTLLQSRNIPYETIDIADKEAKIMIDDLLSVSGISDECPQFFLVDLTTGEATFWGDYSRFQKSVDNNLLEKELFGNLLDEVTESSPEIDNPTISESKATESSSPEDALPNGSPESLLEQFTLQLKRLEENHQAEMLDTERRHAQEIESIRSSFNHDECEATRLQLEERLMAQIREKEERLHDVMKRNEGYQLKLDVLKREVEGTQALLEAKKADMGKFSEENLKHLRLWEKRVNEAEAEIAKAKEHSKMLETSLEDSRKELCVALEQHEKSRGRLKELAIELKARRAECRQLQNTIDEITKEKSALISQVEGLEFQLSDRDRSGSERYEEIEKLRTELSVATAEVDKLQKIVNDKDADNERVLAEYKRKTQSALAMANSRTASAIQSKEEAELEARAARSTADSAMERVVQAELTSKAAVVEAQATVKAMALERDAALKKHEESVAVLEAKTARIEQLQTELVEALATLKGKEDELAKLSSDLSNEKTTSLSYQKDLVDLNARISLLREEVKTLREKLRHAEDAAPSQADQPDDKKPSLQNDAQLSKEAINSSAVSILQQELREANQEITELKEALQNAVDMNDKNKMNQGEDTVTAASTESDGHGNTNGSNDSIPLFYAMEKQAELNVARNEITRLANLLSNAQAQKMEAFENAEEMRRKMEDAEARLKRFEKLRPSSGRESTGDAPDISTPSLEDSGAVNIEYLKNIMLRYLNATSLSEKRALVPVVGAVLCLTKEEQQKAIASLEESASIGGVGSTLFETFSGKLISK